MGKEKKEINKNERGPLEHSVIEQIPEEQLPYYKEAGEELGINIVILVSEGGKYRSLTGFPSHGVLDRGR